MNKKQIMIIGGVFIVVFFMYFALIRQDVKEDAGGQVSSVDRNHLIPDFDVNSVAKFKVHDPQTATTLIKKDGLWRVEQREDYPANFTKVKNSLMKIKDLKTAQKLTLTKTDLPKLKLVNPGAGAGAGTQVEFFNDKDSVMNRIVLGKMHDSKQPSPHPYFNFNQSDGRFLRVENGNDKIYLVADTLAEFTPKPVDWLEKDFVKIKKIKKMTLTKADGKSVWTITKKKEGEKFQLAGLAKSQEVEKTKFNKLTSVFGYFPFDDVYKIDNEKIKGCLAKPDVITIETFEDFTYKLNIGKIKDKYYLKLEVACNIHKDRKPGKDEKPEDKEKLDSEFKENTAKLQEKLDKEKAYEKWIYEIPKSKVETLVIPRKDLIKVAKKDDKKKAVKPIKPVPGTVKIKKAPQVKIQPQPKTAKPPVKGTVKKTDKNPAAKVKPDTK